MSLAEIGKAATTIEIGRLIRHAAAPLVAVAVSRGWLPESAQSETVEAFAVIGSVGVMYAWSLIRDRKRNSRADQRQPDSNGADSASSGVAGPEGQQRTSASQGGEEGQ